MDKIVANSALEKIMGLQSNFFQAVDAQELINQIPLTEPDFNTGLEVELVNKDTGERKFVGIDVVPHWQVGHYDVQHTPGLLEISRSHNLGSDMFHLHYDAATKEPTRLTKAEQKTFSLPLIFKTLRFSKIVFEDWKKPSFVEADKKFHVIRQDSNGNHFFEAQSLSEELADALLDKRQKEIGDHHQTIWKQDAALPLPQPFHH